MDNQPKDNPSQQNGDYVSSYTFNNNPSINENDKNFYIEFFNNGIKEYETFDRLNQNNEIKPQQQIVNNNNETKKNNKWLDFSNYNVLNNFNLFGKKQYTPPAKLPSQTDLSPNAQNQSSVNSSDTLYGPQKRPRLNLENEQNDTINYNDEDEDYKKFLSEVNIINEVIDPKYKKFIKNINIAKDMMKKYNNSYSKNFNNSTILLYKSNFIISFLNYFKIKLIKKAANDIYGNDDKVNQVINNYADSMHKKLDINESIKFVKNAYKQYLISTYNDQVYDVMKEVIENEIKNKNEDANIINMFEKNNTMLVNYSNRVKKLLNSNKYKKKYYKFLEQANNQINEESNNFNSKIDQDNTNNIETKNWSGSSLGGKRRKQLLKIYKIFSKKYRYKKHGKISKKKYKYYKKY